METVGLVRRRGVAAQEKEPGRGRVGSRVEGSWTGGWRQEVSSTLVGIRELLREQNGYLKRISQSLDWGLGAGDDDDDSTIRE